ncbi:tRNA wybutosine-synthesizing protein 2/3/4 [Nicotiana tomentosiformis]|uniref:tRNA wybutosine-synthesizing protein 2/3/4 n=1 Tax=Nicotiana tomentosiformis TaxID=4098 RepID=UPI00051C38F3|nr:tRNA wybutosine-synthesizing protein 2/3/4 [Nicotiana tomentosiformis]
MEFEKRKAATVASINSPETDKSPKGNIDAPIIPLLNTLNSHPSYFTTSSCSGRISILSTPTTPFNNPTKKKAKGGKWVFISHDPIQPHLILPLLFSTESTQKVSELNQPHSLVFRFEPLIIAVECKDIESAQFLVSLAISCGFRESGITSVNKKRVIIAIRCSIRLEVPLGDTEKLMVSPEYVEYLVMLANEKMETNKKRTDSFLDALLKNGFSGTRIGNEEFLDNGKVECDEGPVCFNTKEAGLLENSLGNAVSGNGNAKRRDFDDSYSGSEVAPEINLHTVKLVISGESIERLFLWGHSASTVDNVDNKKVLIFGGFGGIGRHARRDDLLLLDIESGRMEVIDVLNAPCPRVGHTSSMIGDSMYVIGGRADPLNILNDVWVFNVTKKDWRLLECSNSPFLPRHRHAAAAVGSRIYVFGGIQNDLIFSSVYVFDTQNFEWSEVQVQGDFPCARHSHSMAAYGSQLFVFGGYDGQKALGDLYSFDVKTCLWKKEKMIGGPAAKFSHSMFIYKKYLGIIGGCPVSQQNQRLSLLNLESHLWKHITISSIGEGLFVRSTANIVDNDLIMIGGGAACYAFGTKFSEPVKVDLLPLISLIECPTHLHEENKHAIYQEEETMREMNISSCFPQNEVEPVNNGSFHQNSEGRDSGIAGSQMVASHWVIRLKRKDAKMAKDMLKKFGWLDLGRKVHPQDDGKDICFPVTENFCALFNQRNNLGDVPESVCQEGIPVKDTCISTALNILIECGATILADEIVRVEKASHSPFKVMSEAVATLLSDRGLPLQLLEELPSRWERLGDIVVLPVTSFKDSAWDLIGQELWFIVAKSLGAHRLARQGRIAPTGTRDSTLEILVGDDGWVNHRENGILYSFDATKCMFSWGNLSEKLRMGHFDCKDEVIVDLFAGIGYFVLPFLVRAKAKLMYACEWNPYAVEALRRNVEANLVADRCVLLEGDNRITAPKGVADRVCLGLIPTSEGSWVTAVRALREKGGILHIHGNVKDSEENVWTNYVSQSIQEIARSEGHYWDVSVEHVERVKWYAPHIRHLVADVRCKQIQT